MPSKPVRLAAAPAPRIFSPAEATRLLSQEPGRPSGVVVNIGGFDVDLHPFTTEEGDAFFDIMANTTEFQEKLAEKKATEVDFTRLLSTEGKRIAAIIKSLVKNSLGVKESDAAAFDAWFGRQQLLTMVRQLIPAVIEANGFGAMIRAHPQEAPTETEPAAP